MKTGLMGLMVMAVCYLGSWAGSHGAVVVRAEALASENERLRLFNAREVRRYRHPEASVRWESVGRASHLLGVPESMIGAVWQQENGPPDIETGVLGKTDYFATHFPLADWPALETARTLNVWAWDWLLSTADGKAALKKMLLHTAKPYTALGPVAQVEWMSRVVEFQKALSAEGVK